MSEKVTITPIGIELSYMRTYCYEIDELTSMLYSGYSMEMQGKYEWFKGKVEAILTRLNEAAEQLGLPEIEIDYTVYEHLRES